MTTALNEIFGQCEQFQRGSPSIGIFKLAELFGVTTEALRKYEAQSILMPDRGENKYRKYSSWDLTKIIMVRQLRLEGLSLKDIGDVLSQETPARQLRDMAKLQQTLREEIAYREKLIRWIDQQREETLHLQALGDTCAVEQQGRIYCCVYLVDNTLVKKTGTDLAHLKEWLQALPFTRICFIKRPSGKRLYGCLSLREEEREQYGLAHLTPDFIVPAGDNVVCRMAVKRTQTQNTTMASMQTAREKAERMNHPLKDFTMVEMLWYTQRSDQFSAYSKAIFPVETAE